MNSRERRTRELGNPPAGMRARGQWTRGTRGDPTELPRRLAVGYGGNNERRLPCRGTDTNKQTGTKQKTFEKNGKQNGVNGRRLRLGLVFCHGAHTREEQEHGDEDVNSNNSI